MRLKELVLNTQRAKEVRGLGAPGAQSLKPLPSARVMVSVPGRSPARRSAGSFCLCLSSPRSCPRSLSFCLSYK